MSDHGVDPAYLELVARDVAFRIAVQDFIHHHPPESVTPFVRGALHNMVFSYYGTSQNMQMQRHILQLHDTYNLEGLMDMALLDNIRQTVNAPATMDPTQSPVQPGPLSAAAPSPNGNANTNTNLLSGNPSSPVMAAASNGTINRNPAGIERCVTTKDGDPRWAYKCDACGHEIRFRSEFVRHVKIALGRVGFRIVKADPANDPLWYGMDDAGSVYTGDIVARQGARAGMKPRIPPPCGPQITAHRKQSRMDATDNHADDGEEDEEANE
ncbi:hypothetical protein CLAIMM_11253 [Cladophialophora immunda]|nr:hypothetical protein CLAIMM_11253 [Cladophialophora immunda]